jgi:hypothetical protein
VSASLPPRFQDRVWQRLARVESGAATANRVPGWLARLHAVLLQPRLAAGYVTVLLLLGFAAGWTQGLEKSARVDEDLSLRYVHVIDPYQVADAK